MLNSITAEVIEVVLENSRKKKSHAADVADMAQKIVKCISSKDAEDLIEQIKTKVERK